MLIHISVSNFQLIENANIELHSNLIACTGESGSGKSSLLNAVSIGLGLLRADENFIRKNEDKATIELHFSIQDFTPLLREQVESIRKELGLDPEEPRLILTRTIERKRPSRSQIDAKSVPLKVLQNLGMLLCEILDQGAGHSLATATSAKLYLDAFAGKKHQELKKEVEDLYNKLQNILQEKDRLTALQPLASTKIPLLEEEVAQIESSLEDMEQEAELFAQFSGCAEAEEKKQTLSQICTFFESISDPIQKSTILLKKEHFASLLQQAQQLHSTWQECSWLAEKELEQCEVLYDRDTIEEKLQRIERIKRRFGKDISEVKNHYEKAQNELWELHCLSDRLSESAAQVTKAQEQLEEKVTLLTKSRKKASKELSKILSIHLNELNFEGAVAQVEVTEAPLSKDGRESLRFLLTPGKGARAIDLHKSASGGERARFFLALKLAGCQQDPPPLLILDEVDASLGGVSAKKMQEKLLSLSKERQILCITHFPQVAKEAPQHICVEKNCIEGKVQSRFIDLVQSQQRDKELQRMLGERAESA